MAWGIASRGRALLLGAFSAVVFLGVTAPRLDDFGATWDFGQLVWGERAIDAITHLDPERADPRTFRGEPPPGRPDPAAYCTEGPWLVWPLGVTLAAATCRLFHDQLHWLPPMAAYHAASLLASAALLGFLIAWGARRIGVAAALIGGFLLGTWPAFLWHALANFKDPPAAALCFAGAVLAIEAVVAGAAATNRRLACVAGICGLALAAKGNALIVPVTGVVGIVASCGVAPLVRVLVAPRQVLRWSLAIAGALVVAVAAWPWLWSAPLDHLADHWRVLRENWSGAQGEGAGLAAIASETPLPVWLGVALALPLLRKPSLRLVAVCALVPALNGALPTTKSYDGIRRFLEFTPALALLAGAGLANAAQFVAARLPRALRPATMVAGGAMLAVAALRPDFASHPDEHLWRNELAPRATADPTLESPDFWAHSMRRLFEWLALHAPAGARVVAPANAPLAAFSNELWGRPDLQVISSERLGPETLDGRPVVFACVARPGLMSDAGYLLPALFPPDHVVTAGGVPLATATVIDGDDRKESRQLARLARTCSERSDARIAAARDAARSGNEVEAWLCFAVEVRKRSGMEGASTAVEALITERRSDLPAAFACEIRLRMVELAALRLE